MKDSGIKCFAAGGIGTLCSLIVLDKTLVYIKNSDVLCVILSFFAFCLCTIMCYCILVKINMDFFYKDNKIWCRLVYAIFGVLTIGLSYDFLKSDIENEGDRVSGFWWHKIPSWIVIVVLLFCAVFMIYRLTNERSDKTINKTVLNFYYVVMSVVYAGTVVYLNVFAGDLYHIDAYIHPIYNVYYNTPYSSVSHSIYGHYELFYKIPMLIFGTSPLVICVVIGIIAIIQEWIILKIIDELVTSKIIKMVAPIAMLVPTGCMFVSSSYQTTPHRVIFPVALILYGKKCAEVENFSIKSMILGNIICTASFIWNTETGAVCCIAWFAYSLIRVLQNRIVRIKDFIKQLALGIIFVIADVLFAILYANIYNFLVGGGIFIKEFFFPFINDGFIAHYNISLLFDNVPYIYVYILAIGAITYGVSKTTIFQKKIYCKTAAPVVLAGIILLGQLLYYVSRATYYGLLITFPVAFILICFFADVLVRNNVSVKSNASVFEALKYSIGGISASCIAVLICMSGILGEKYADSFSMGRYDIGSYEKRGEIEELANNVEKGTYAVGWGTDEIYGILGWDTGYHMLGTTDVLVDPDANKKIYDVLCEEVKKKDKVLLNTSAYQLLNLDFKMLNEFDIFGETYGYFEKSEYDERVYIPYGNQSLQARFLKDNEMKLNNHLRICGYVYSTSEMDLDGTMLGLRNTNTGEIFKIDTYTQDCISVPEELKDLQDIKLKKLYARVRSDDLYTEASVWEIVLLKQDENLEYICTGDFINM